MKKENSELFMSLVDFVHLSFLFSACLSLDLHIVSAVVSLLVIRFPWIVSLRSIQLARRLSSHKHPPQNKKSHLSL